MSDNAIPDKNDWGETSDLDVNYAFQQFFGKSNVEMQEAFKENVLTRAEDIGWMPQKPFTYYIIGFGDSIRACIFDKTDMSDAASCYLNLIENKLRESPDWLSSVWDRVYPTVTYIVKNQSKFDADIDIYGDFEEKLASIKTLAKSNSLRI